jgi:sugar lactone lactonase YvrE
VVLWVDTASRAIRTYTPATGLVGTYHAMPATFSTPSGLAWDASTTPPSILVADTGFNRVRRLYPETGRVVTVAGSPTGSAGETNGAGTNALFNNPNGAAIDPSCGARGCMYVGTYLGARLRKVDLATRAVTLLTGNAAAP